MKSHVTAQSVQVKEILELVGDKGTVQTLKTGEANLVKAKAGEKYRIVKKLGGKEEIVDDVVATKSDESLQLQYADGTHVTFEGFYQENSSSVELTANEGGIHTIASMGEMSSTDGNVLVYAHGNHDRLMGMTQGNEPLQVAVAKQTSVSGLPHYAAVTTGAVTDASSGGAAGGAGGGGAAGGAGGFLTGIPNAVLYGVGALGLGGVAIAVGSSGGEDSTPDTTAPVITSGTTATAIDENSGASQVVYTAAATDASAVTYTLKAATGDVALFTINSTTGAVTLTADPNFEAKSSYSFTVVATDAANNASEQAVTLAINNVNEAPVITSAATAMAIDENSGAGQVVYAAIATDEDTADTITYSLGGTDAGLFSIDGVTGAVTLTADPNFETKSSYSFNVIATDNGTGALSDTQAVTLAINNLDEVAPTITSGTTATAIDENSGANQVVYTATSTDTGDIAIGSTTYSLKAGSDAGLTIDGTTGAVTLTADPNFETKSSYSFTVVATDASNNASEQAVTLAINNLDEVAPTITSGATAVAIDENSGASQVIYTATSTDTGDIATGSTTYSLKAGSDAGLTIDGTTGAVTLTADPNFEAKSSYSFTVVATDAANNASEQAVTLAINNVNEAPVITSAATAMAIDENSGAGQVVYAAIATDEDTADTITYSLGGTDAGLFSIDGVTGAVTLTADPNFETKSSYSFNVIATDNGTGALSDTQAVTLAINNLDEVAPTITSGATAVAIDENSGASQVVYTATSTDTGDIAVGSTTYSLKTGSDAGLTINSSTGAVTLTVNPDYETKASYSFTVVATDAANNVSEQAVTLAINDMLDETPPVITSGTTATAIDENSGASQVVYTAAATDASAVTYTLKAATGDVALFTINSTTGAVTLTADPNFEAKSSYSFTVVATDASNNASEQAVTLAINNVNEAPVITSAATATAINENSGAGQLVYTAIATDVDAGTVLTYSLGGTDAALFAIDSASGEVTLIADPNFEGQSSYSFDVIATDNGTGLLSDTQAVTLAINDVNDAAVISGTLTGSVTEDTVGWSLTSNNVSWVDLETFVGTAITTTTVEGDPTNGSAITFDLTTSADNEEVSFNWDFAANDGSYDFSFVVIDGVYSTLERGEDVDVNGYTLLSYAFATAGQHTISFGVMNSGDTAVDNNLAITYVSGGTINNVTSVGSVDAGLGIGTATHTDVDADNADNVFQAVTTTATVSGYGTYSVTTEGVWTYILDNTNVTVNALSASQSLIDTFNVTAEDGTTAAVSVTITGANDAPVITSAATAAAINENSGAGQTVYTVTATDVDTADSITYSLGGTDAGLFTINGSSGAVTLTANPDFETKSSYSFDVIATDNGTGLLSDTQAVTLAINDVNEDVTPPYIVNAQFTKGATTTLTMVFSEAIAEGSATPTFWLNGSTEITPTDAVVSGNTATITFNVATTSSDVISINAPIGVVVDLAGNSSASGTIIAGSSDASTMALNTLYFENIYSDRMIFGGDGNDVITGTNQTDIIYGGEGADTIGSNWSADYIHLDETTAVRDTVMVSKPESSDANSTVWNTDIVFDFDTTSATAANHDVLGFEIVQIAVNQTTGSYSITNGIATFSSVVNSSNVTTAISALQAGLGLNDIVGIKYDSDSNGSVDSLLVYQKTDNPSNDTLIALANIANIGSVTLGTAAGANVVQIVDKVGPEPMGVQFSTNQMAVGFTETLSANNMNGNVTFKIGSGASLTNITGTVTQSADVAYFNTSATVSSTQYLLISRGTGVTGDLGFNDQAGNLGTLLYTDETGIAVGNTSTSLIDLSGLSGDYSIVNFISTVNSTLIGNNGNNSIEGGSGADTITGGAGADDLRAGDGDTFVFAQGDSTVVTLHDNDTSGTINANDVFTFTAGTDVVDFWDMLSGESSTIQLATGMTQTVGTVGENQFKLVEGWYDWDSEVFTVQSGGGSTLVIYDGTAGAGVSMTGIVLADAGLSSLTITNNLINYVL